MKWLRELDRGWARFEGWLTVGVLLFMVLGSLLAELIFLFFSKKIINVY